MRARRLAVPLLTVLTALAFLPFPASSQSALTGQVLDPGGRPLSGVRVWALADGEWDGNKQSDAVTGDDGTFAVTGIPSRTGIVLAACIADASMEPIALAEVPGEPVDLVLQPAGRIAGRIAGPDGTPVASASVSLVREPRAWGAAWSLAVPLPCDPQDSGRSDAEGRFVLAGLKAGVYALQVHASGFNGNEVRGVRLHSGETVDGIEVQLDPIPGALQSSAETDGSDTSSGEPEPLARHPVSREPEPDPAPAVEVRGQVTGPDGEPVPRARVRASGPGGMNHETLSRADGSFLLRLEDGIWSIAVQADGYLPVSSGSFEVAGRAAAVHLQEIRMQRSLVLRGRFPGLDPGEVPAVRVRRGATVHEGEADPDGGYVVTGLTPGPWTVTAELHADGTWNGSRSAVGQVILQPGDAETFLDLDFDLGAASLTVHAPAGAGSLIASLVRPGGSVLFASGLTESSTVVFDRLRPGTYHLVWSLGERGETRGEQDVALTTDREVTLAPR